MATTHIEVANAHNHYALVTGQLLKIVKETPAYYWVMTLRGHSMQVSKKTGRGPEPHGMDQKGNPAPLFNI